MNTRQKLGDIGRQGRNWDSMTCIAAGKAAMHVILSLVCSIDVSGTYSDLCVRTKPKFNSIDH